MQKPHLRLPALLPLLGELRGELGLARLGDGGGADMVLVENVGAGGLGAGRSLRLR